MKELITCGRVSVPKARLLLKFWQSPVPPRDDLDDYERMMQLAEFLGDGETAPHLSEWRP